MDSTIEKIRCAAIRYRLKDNESETKYMEGLSHASCIGYFSAMDIFAKDRDLGFEAEGFMTTKNRFVDREEAYIIARNSNQLRSENVYGHNILFSENCKYSN